MIINENVVWIGDPETSRGLICVQKTHRPYGFDNEVVLDVIVCFNRIFNEEGMAFDFICHIILKSQVMGTMQCESSIITLMGS